MQRDRRSRVRHHAYLAAAALVVGALAGVAAATLLVTLDRVTAARLGHPWLLWLLPVAGLAVGLVYEQAGGRAGRGTSAVLDEIREPSEPVPARMAPLVLGATAVTHLFGGSAGREGTAIQMSASLADGWFGRRLRLPAEARQVLLVSAVAGGFGAVFGVPWAGVVFALELTWRGRRRGSAVVPAVVASVVGDRVVALLGVGHAHTPTLAAPAPSWTLATQLVAAGAAFGVTAWAFAEAAHAVRWGLARVVRWAPARPALGGLAVLALTAVLGTRDHLGLSLPLLAGSLDAAVGVATWAFAAKWLFTVVTVGSGFHGGEVTPLFVIGATLGATLGGWFGADPVLFAALGHVAVFGAATRTPLACTVMGLELFGRGALVPLALVCAVASVADRGRTIYGAGRVRRVRR